jgi:hypothetical protein
MWNEPTRERLAKIPKLYETENTPARDKLLHLHCFIAGCDWYIAEYDGDDLFWGYAILNEDYEMAEWGYISFSELRDIKLKGWLEVDCEIEEAWPVKRAIEVEKIRIGNGWLKENGAPTGIPKQEELMLKVKAGHFGSFQDLFAEVTSPYSDFFGIDPYPIWKTAREQARKGGMEGNDGQRAIHQD